MRPSIGIRPASSAFHKVTHPGYDRLATAEQNALLNTREFAERPQPIDYGLTCDDLNLYNDLWYHVDADLKYKEGKRWLGVLLRWKTRAYNAGGLAFWLLLIGGLAAFGGKALSDGFIPLGFGLACLLYAILPGAVIAYRAKSPIRVPQTPSTFHLRGQRSVDRRDVRQQRRLFDRENPQFATQRGHNAEGQRRFGRART